MPYHEIVITSISVGIATPGPWIATRRSPQGS